MSSASTDYTPLKSLRIRDNASATRSQVVFSKVARRPVLHHAESWSPETRNYWDQSSSTDYSTYSSLSRKPASCSDYGTLPRGGTRGCDMDDKTVYWSASSHSDYGSLQKRKNSYDFYGRSKPVKTCGCDTHEVCAVCLYTRNSGSKTPSISENHYDSIKRDYCISSSLSTPTYNPPGSVFNYQQQVSVDTPISVSNNNVTKTYYNKNLLGRPAKSSAMLQQRDFNSKQSDFSSIFASLDRSFSRQNSNWSSSTTEEYRSQSYRVFADNTDNNNMKYNQTSLNSQTKVRSNNGLLRPTLNKQLSDQGRLSFSSTPSTPTVKSVTFDLGPDSQECSITETTSYRVPPVTKREEPTPSVRKEWQKLRSMLRVVNAVRKSNTNIKSKLGNKLFKKDSKSSISDSIGLPSETETEAETDAEVESTCECCRDSAMKCPDSFDRKVKAARSYESLLVSGTRIPTVDLGEGNNQVIPLHRSLLGEDNCLKVSSSSGSTFYSCRNSEERSVWLNHLKKTVNPGEDQMRRSDTSLKLWVQEAKNCTAKKKFFCEVSLDRNMLARTSCKQKSEMLFWGEQFDFENLPEFEMVTVTLYKEEDKKKKRDHKKNPQIGYVNIPVSELQNRVMCEKWYTLSSAVVGKSGKENKSELPQIRVKLRYQTVQILPLSSYNVLLKHVKSNYQSLVEKLESLITVRCKEDISNTLVHILQREQMARRFLCDIVISELHKHENLNLMLRGNTIATKAIEAYMKLVGNRYLHETLDEFVRSILESEESCEVDPGKLQNNSSLQRNQNNLVGYCEFVWKKIISSHNYFPSELRDVFTSFRRQCDHLKKPEVADNLISACIFLRFICPAIMSPSLFGLCQELPAERQSRNFTLVAKTLQSLANFTKFGSKEDYMLFMNAFVDREWNQMQNFLKQISTSDHSYPMVQFDGYIDSGKYLSLLHSQLVENLPKPESEERAKFSDLDPILKDLTDELEHGRTDTLSSRKRCNDDKISSTLSSQSSGLKAPRPESDEYVELSQERTKGYPMQLDTTSATPRTNRPTPGRLLNLSAARDIHQAQRLPPPNNNMPSTLPSIPAAHQHRTATVAPHTAAPLSPDYYNKPVTLAHLPERPKDPDADISNRSDSDTMRSNSSSGSKKIVRHRVWDRVLTDNDLVNGDYIDLISYMDDSGHSQSGGDNNQSISTSVPSSGYTSVSNSRASPNDNDEPLSGNVHLNSLRRAKPANLQPGYKEPALAFINPAFKHSTSAITSPRRGSESQTTPEFTPLPNRFHSLNLRGNSKKPDKPSANATHYLVDRSMSNSSTSSATPHHTGEVGGSTGDVLHLDRNVFNSESHSNIMSDSHSSSHSRDEKRFGCAKFPNMELYPETVRSQPEGGNISESLMINQSSEQLDVDRPSTPLSCQSWTGSQLSLNSQQTGIRNVQRKIDETEKVKQQYEAEVAVLRTQLAEAQTRLSGTEGRLAYQAEQTNHVIEEWKARLDESEERLKAQQMEKDEQIKSIITRLLAIEEDLRQEQQDMRSAISRKEQIIDSQERRIRELDTANSKLQKTLNDLKDKVQRAQQPAAADKTYKTTLYVNDYKSSSLC